MPKLSDEDFDQVVADFQRTTIGAALVRDYVPIKGTMLDADGAEVEGDPTIDNAFVIRVEQRPPMAGKLACTRIVIHGPDGLEHTSHECDHVHFEKIDDVDHTGRELLVDVEHARKVTTMQRVGKPAEIPKIADFTDQAAFEDALDEALSAEVQFAVTESAHYESYVLIPKGTVLTADHVQLMRDRGISRIGTRLRTAEEIASLLSPLLENEHEIAGTKLAASELATLGSLKKAQLVMEGKIAADPVASGAGILTK